MRKSSRESVQKSNTVAIEKRLGLIRGCDSQLEGEMEGDGDQDKTKDWLSEKCKSTDVNLKATLPP